MKKIKIPRDFKKAVGRGLKDAIAFQRGELRPRFNALILAPDAEQPAQDFDEAPAAPTRHRGKQALFES